MAEYRVTTAQNPTDLLTLRTEPGWVIAYGTGDDIAEDQTVNGLDGPWAGEAAAVVAALWACAGAWGHYEGEAMNILDAVDDADQATSHRFQEWTRPGRWYAAVQVRVVGRDAAVVRAEAAEREAECLRYGALIEAAQTYARLLKEPDTLEAYNDEEVAQGVLMSAAAALGEAQAQTPAEQAEEIGRSLADLMTRLDGDAAIAVDVARRGLERVAKRLGEVGHG